MITAHFNQIKENILEEVIKAKKSVWLATAYFADRSIFNLLCSMAKSGIDVRLLIADEKTNMVQSEIDYGELVKAGGHFFIANRTVANSLMHHKFCVIDELTTVTGSYNYTIKAKSNIENIVIIESEAIANQYTTEFKLICDQFSTPLIMWEKKFLPYGYVELDKITDGFHFGELICLAAQQGMGTTSFALNVAHNLATNFNRSVGFISTDLNTAQIGSRLISIHNDISLKGVQQGKLEEFEWQSIHLNALAMDNAPLQVCEADTIEQIELKSKGFYYQNFELIIIDKIDNLFKGNYNYKENTAVIERLKSLSRQIRIPILFTHTLPKKERSFSFQRRPLLDDLTITYNHIDTIIFLHRFEHLGVEYDEDNQETRGIAELIVAKSYDGEASVLKLLYNRNSLKFMELPDRPAKQEYSKPANMDSDQIIRPSRLFDLDDNEAPF